MGFIIVGNRFNFYKSKYQQEVKEFRISKNEGSGAVVKVRFDDIS